MHDLLSNQAILPSGTRVPRGLGQAAYPSTVGFLRYSRELWNIGKQNSRTLAKLHKPIYKAPGINSGK